MIEQQEREDDDNISLASDNDEVTIEDVLEPSPFNIEKLPELPTVSELSKNPLSLLKTLLNHLLPITALLFRNQKH